MRSLLSGILFRLCCKSLPPTFIFGNSPEEYHAAPVLSLGPLRARPGSAMAGQGEGYSLSPGPLSLVLPGERKSPLLE